MIVFVFVISVHTVFYSLFYFISVNIYLFIYFIYIFS